MTVDVVVQCKMVCMLIDCSYVLEHDCGCCSPMQDGLHAYRLFLRFGT